nr:hypothetical protein [uncultured bacterium]
MGPSIVRVIHRRLSAATLSHETGLEWIPSGACVEVARFLRIACGAERFLLHDLDAERRAAARLAESGAVEAEAAASLEGRLTSIGEKKRAAPGQAPP